MGKIYTAMGLMSGTSLDGVDVSIIESDGNQDYTVIFDGYFQYNNSLNSKILEARDKIFSKNDLNLYTDQLKSIEKEITLFHVKAVKKH